MLLPRASKVPDGHVIKIYASAGTSGWKSWDSVGVAYTKDFVYHGSVKYMGDVEYKTTKPEIITKEVIVEKPVYIYKEVPVMWTWTNIGIVVLIVLFTVKVILPRFNWRFGIRWFVRLFWKPAKKEVKTITAEWEDANKEQ
jgi:hypothetical protein